MSSIVQTSDFQTGEFTIPVNTYTSSNLQAYITRLEREWLIKLLGAELYALFFADLTGTPAEPQTAIYTTIFEQGAWDDILADVLISDGMVKMLKGIIFYEYVKDSNSMATISGMVTNANENSTVENKEKGSQILTQKYASAISTFNAIQAYINDNLSDYPDFNGMTIKQSSFFW